MSFDASTKILTVSPGALDFGSYTLNVSYSTTFDGLAPGSKVYSPIFTIYRLEIGAGTITN